MLNLLQKSGSVGPGGKWIGRSEKCLEELGAGGLLCTSIQGRYNVAWRWRAKCMANMPNYSPPPKKRKGEKKDKKIKPNNIGFLDVAYWAIDCC